MISPPQVPFESADPSMRLIRITGGKRIADAGPVGRYVTAYSWAGIKTPNFGWAPPIATGTDDPGYVSRPTELAPTPDRTGPRDADANQEQPALEVSGCDSVPTDGSTVVWAWYDQGSFSWRFQYAGTRFMRITGTKETDGDFYYEAVEVESYYAGSGNSWKWQAKTYGISSGEATLASGTLVKMNPLVEISGNQEVPIGTIACLVRAPIPTSTNVPGANAFYRPSPMIDIVPQATGTGSTTAKAAIKIVGAVGGTYVLSFIDPNGNKATSKPIDISTSTTDLQTAIQAVMTNSAAATVSGTDASDFTLDMMYPGLWKITANPGGQGDPFGLFSDAPLYFVNSHKETDDIFPVTANDRQLISGTYTYGWIGIDDSSLVGTLPAIAVFTHTQIHDGLNPDIYAIYIRGGTGGTFTLTDSGGSPSTAIAYNASHSTVQSALTNFTVTGSGTSSSPWILTGAAGNNSGTGTGNTLTIDGTNLLPAVSHGPLTFLNNVPMKVPVNVWAKLKSGKDPDIRAIPLQVGNGTVPAKFTITLADIVDGTFTGTFDGGTASAAIPWNPTATQLQTALNAVLGCTVTGTDHTGPFTVTVTADNNPHSLALADAGLFGTKVYREVWSNGDACAGPIGGIYAPSINGWVGAGVETYSGRVLTLSTPPAPTLSISPTGSSAGPWTITSSGASGGTFQITVDGGSPTSTAYNACPTISGFTTSGSVGACILTAASGSHTLLAFGALLTSTQPRQFLTIGSDLCVDLIDPRQC